jgi:hypothetical protein
VSHAEDHAGTRRDFLYYATAGAGVVATGAAVWPLVNQMNPSADTRALASIFVDVSGVEVGTQLTVKWRGKPVFIRRRTPKRSKAARAVNLDDLIDKSAENAEQAGSGSHRREPHPRRGRRMAGDDRRLHPPGLRADRQRRGRVRRLVLPLPRLALRHGRPHPQRDRRRATWTFRSRSSPTKPPSFWAEEQHMAGIPHDHYEPKSGPEKWLHAPSRSSAAL